MEQGFEVVSPIPPRSHRRTIRTEPLKDLNGKTIAQLWDHAFKGDELFDIIRLGLQKRFPDVKFVDYSVFGNTHGAYEDKVIANIPRLLKDYGCDAVISGVGG